MSLWVSFNRIILCDFLGLSAPQSGIQNISYDLLRADKKSKQCRADHFAEVRIKIWSFSSSSLAELVPSFDPGIFEYFHVALFRRFHY